MRTTELLITILGATLLALASAACGNPANQAASTVGSDESAEAAIWDPAVAFGVPQYAVLVEIVEVSEGPYDGWTTLSVDVLNHVWDAEEAWTFGDLIPVNAPESGSSIELVDPNGLKPTAGDRIIAFNRYLVSDEEHWVTFALDEDWEFVDGLPEGFDLSVTAAGAGEGSAEGRKNSVLALVAEGLTYNDSANRLTDSQRDDGIDGELGPLLAAARAATEYGEYFPVPDDA